MFYTVYKITNLINGKIYIGVHKTSNIDDGYMGSGTMIKRAENKYGIENFQKEILKVFDNPEDMFQMESELVNEDFVKDKSTYNLKLGGYGGWYNAKGKIAVKDKDGNYCRVANDDPRYLSGELVGVVKGMVIVKDKDDNYYQVNKDDPRYLSGELVGVVKGMLTVKDKDDNYFRVSNDDPRYLSGELTKANNAFKGKHHSEETKKLMSEKAKQRTGSKNSQFGTCWIYNPTLKENKKIKKSLLSEYLNEGWIKGRKLNNVSMM